MKILDSRMIRRAKFSLLMLIIFFSFFPPSWYKSLRLKPWAGQNFYSQVQILNIYNFLYFLSKRWFSVLTNFFLNPVNSQISPKHQRHQGKFSLFENHLISNCSPNFLISTFEIGTKHFHEIQMWFFHCKNSLSKSKAAVSYKERCQFRTKLHKFKLKNPTLADLKELMYAAYDCFNNSQELPTYNDTALRKLCKIFDLFSRNLIFFDEKFQNYSEVFGTVIIRLKALGYSCETDSFCPLLSDMSHDHLVAYNAGFTKNFQDYFKYLISVTNSTSKSPITSKLVVLALFDKAYISMTSNSDFRQLKDVLNRLDVTLPDLSGYVSKVQLRNFKTFET